jgi:hypothetical protein
MSFTSQSVCQSFPGLLGYSSACFYFSTTYNTNNATNSSMPMPMPMPAVCGSFVVSMTSGSTATKNLGCVNLGFNLEYNLKN